MPKTRQPFLPCNIAFHALSTEGPITIDSKLNHICDADYRGLEHLIQNVTYGGLHHPPKIKENTVFSYLHENDGAIVLNYDAQDTSDESVMSYNLIDKTHEHRLVQTIHPCISEPSEEKFPLEQDDINKLTGGRAVLLINMRNDVLDFIPPGYNPVSTGKAFTELKKFLAKDLSDVQLDFKPAPKILPQVPSVTLEVKSQPPLQSNVIDSKNNAPHISNHYGPSEKRSLQEQFYENQQKRWGHIGKGQATPLFGQKQWDYLGKEPLPLKQITTKALPKEMQTGPYRHDMSTYFFHQRTQAFVMQNDSVQQMLRAIRQEGQQVTRKEMDAAYLVFRDDTLDDRSSDMPATIQRVASALDLS